MASLFASSEVYAKAVLMRNSHISLGTLREKDTGRLFRWRKKQHSVIHHWWRLQQCGVGKQEVMLDNLGADKFRSREASG
jgi:hypothetical protein